MPNKLELSDLAEHGLADPAPSRAPRDMEAVYDIPVTVSAVLGKATMQVSQLLKLGRGDRHLCKQPAGGARRGGDGR